MKIQVQGSESLWALMIAAVCLGVGFFGMILEYAGFPGCFLCWVERWLFLGAGSLAGLVWGLSMVGATTMGMRISSLGCFMLLGITSGVSFYHSGIQYGVFPVPHFCTVEEGKGDTVAAQLDDFLKQSTRPSCDEQTLTIWSIPASLYGGGISLACMVLAGVYGLGAYGRHRRRQRR